MQARAVISRACMARQWQLTKEWDLCLAAQGAVPLYYLTIVHFPTIHPQQDCRLVGGRVDLFAAGGAHSYS